MNAGAFERKGNPEGTRGLGQPSYKKLLFKNCGVREPCFGVKIGDMKKIEKRIIRAGIYPESGK